MLDIGCGLDIKLDIDIDILGIWDCLSFLPFECLGPILSPAKDRVLLAPVSASLQGHKGCNATQATRPANCQANCACV
jgi:hypothetical protein